MLPALAVSVAVAQLTLGIDRDYALATLTDALNTAAGSTVWAFVQSPPESERPALADEDVIRSAFIYKPADVTLVGASKILTTSSGAGQPFSMLTIQSVQPSGT